MARTRDFLLPDLGEGLTEGEIVSWLVAVGDTVDVDQPVAEVSTAKAVVEVPSPFAGTVTALHADAGDEVEVGAPLLTISEAGDAPAAPDAPPADGGPGSVADGTATSDMVPPTDGDDEGDEGGSGSVLVGYGTQGSRRGRRRRGGAAAVARTAPHAPQAPPAEPDGVPGRPLAKPPVRKLAKDLGVDLRDVRGSGPDGVVTREDVHAAAAGEPAAAPGAAPVEPDVLERLPLRGVRKLIAEKMTVSRREIPEATTWVDADATALWELRERLNARQDGVRVSALALVLRAVVAGLRRFPALNARLEAGEILHLRPVHLGVATHTDRGLVVPVIRDAHARSTLELATELSRLAAGARDGTLPPSDLVGSTFSVSNYGSFGVDGGSPVINHPEAGILGVGRISERPWVVDGSLAVRRVVQLSIAFDHRICDGGEAAGFLRFVADCVEDPGTLLAHV